MPLGMHTLRPIVAIVGVLSLVAAVGAFLVFEDFNLPVRILAAAGVLLVGTYVALDPEDVWRRLTAQRALYGGNAALMVAAVVGILVLVNALGTRFSQRWDLTSSGQFTLSERTQQILERLEQPVQVSAFFENEDPSRTRAEDLLKEYQVRAGGKVRYEFVDPEAAPGKAIQLGVRDFGAMVFQQGDRRQTTTGITEQEFTAALLKLTRPDRKKVYFTQGHGERSLDSAEQDGYAEVKRTLEQDNYEVKTTNLMTEQRVPADAAAVIIAGPTKDFLNEEKQELRDYLAAGGKIIFLRDPRVEVKLDELFSQWGISLGNDPVIDPGSAFLGDPATPVIQRYAPHPIVENLRAASFFPLAAPVHLPREPTEGVQIVPLAQSTDQSWVETDPQTAQFDEGKDQRGPVAMAVVVEAGATTTDQSRPAASPQPRRTRVVIVGDSDFVANNFLRVPAGNLDLFVNAVNWLAESEELISIRPKERDNRQMLLTNTQINLLLVTSAIFLPLVVLSAGAAVWWARR